MIERNSARVLAVVAGCLTAARAVMVAMCAIALLSLTSSANAGAVEPTLVVETLSASEDGDEAYEFPGFGDSGLMVKKVYVDGLEVGDEVLAVFGDPTTPATIQTSAAGFFNGPEIGQVHGKPNPAAYENNPSLQWDTWVAIDDGSFMVAPGFPNTAMEGGGENVVDDNDLAWFSFFGVVTNTGKVLIGQFAFEEGSSFDITISVNIRRGGVSMEFRDLSYSFDPPGDPVGACCVERNCVEVDEATCTMMAGTYSGDGTSCADEDCEDDDPPPPPLPGACCIFGDCAEITEEFCTLSGGTFHGAGTTCAVVDCSPAPTEGACCIMGDCVELTEELCTLSQGTFHGVGTACGDVSCDPPPAEGACCIMGDCAQLTEDLCSLSGGTFHGVGVSCDAVNCDGPPALEGACCIFDSCVEVTEEICLLSAGRFQGVGSTCLLTDCSADPTAGACCFMDGTCAEMTAVACGLAKGTFNGVGSSCNTVDCTPPPVGACCDNGVCRLVTEDNCAAIGGVYQGDDTSCIDINCPLPAAVGSGCGVGYWKQGTQALRNKHPHWPFQHWPEQPLADVFIIPDCITAPDIRNGTLLDALNFGGGPGVNGAARIMLRSAVAALLNASVASNGFCNTEYPLIDSQHVVEIINQALARCDRQRFMQLHTALNGYNELGCSLNNRGDCDRQPRNPLGK